MKAKKLSFRRPHHIFARFVCLLLAVIFWLYVMYVAAPPYDATYVNITVNVVESEAIPFTGEADPIAAVRVVGSKAALAACESGDIIATVSLSDLEGISKPLVGGMLYPLKVSFSTPEGITIEGEYTVSVLLNEVDS